MTPVWDYPDAVRDFVSHGIWGDDRGFSEGPALGFATEAEGLVAGVIYHNYNPYSGYIELSAYSSRRDWLTKERLKLVFAYPFGQLGLRLAVARCSEKNKRVVRIWKALGATATRIPDLLGPDEAEIFLTLPREAWARSRFAR